MYTWMMIIRQEIANSAFLCYIRQLYLTMFKLTTHMTLNAYLWLLVETYMVTCAI